MRSNKGWLILLSLALAAGAEEGGVKPPAGANAAGGAAPPAEPPAFRMADSERRAFEKLLQEYVDPGKKPRQEILDRFDKFVGKPVAGHSVLEDVEGISEIATAVRGFNPKAGKGKGKLVEEEIRPEVHGFPGGIGTVKYFLYLPKDYTPARLWPVLFCLPDNAKWAEGSAYVDETWLKRGEKIAGNYIVAVPRPQTKGESWASPKSLARAMITLRYLAGTFDPEKKEAGPAVDPRRIFIDGDGPAAVIAARFAEVFAGAILHKVDGAPVGDVELRRVGGLNGLAAYSVVESGKGPELQFAQRLKAANDLSGIEEAAADKVGGDPEAIFAWMEALPRTRQLRKIEYAVHDPSFQRHHWINVLEYDPAAQPAPGFAATCDRAGNVVRIEPNGLSRFELFLNDALVDLSRELRIVVVDNEKEIEFFKGKPERKLSVLLDELLASNHPWRIYPVRFIVDMPSLRKVQAQREAEEAAAREKDKGAAAPAEKS